MKKYLLRRKAITTRGLCQTYAAEGTRDANFESILHSPVALAPEHLYRQHIRGLTPTTLGDIHPHASNTPSRQQQPRTRGLLMIPAPTQLRLPHPEGDHQREAA
jgi:hypothetical protein